MHAGLACSLAQRDLRSSDHWCMQDSPVRWYRETLFAHGLITSARRTRLFTSTERLLFARLITFAHRTHLFAGTERHSFARLIAGTHRTRLIAGTHRTRLFTSTERSHSSAHWYTQRAGLFAGTESITHTALFTLTVFVCSSSQNFKHSSDYTHSLICSSAHWCTQDSSVPWHREILYRSSDRWCLQNLSVSLAQRDSYYCTLPLV